MWTLENRYRYGGKLKTTKAMSDNARRDFNYVQLDVEHDKDVCAEDSLVLSEGDL